MNNKLITYKKSGVNINAADKFVNFISSVSSKKRGKKKFSNIDTPDDGHDREMTNGSVVVRRVCDSMRHPDPSFYDKNIYS
jgi:phosphoribosylaminoimidazole (AIR) synthetase